MMILFSYPSRFVIMGDYCTSLVHAMLTLVLFNNTWSQRGHHFGVMYDHTHFLCLQRTYSDIRPQVHVGSQLGDGFQMANLIFLTVCVGMHGVTNVRSAVVVHFITSEGKSLEQLLS